MDIHKDVIDAIYKFQLESIIGKYPNTVTDVEVTECFFSGLIAYHKKYEDLFNKYESICEEYKNLANRVLEMQRSNFRDRRILNLFLQNNGIDEYVYDFFESRILAKLHNVLDSLAKKNKERTSP